MWSVHSGDYVEPLTSDLSRVSPSPSWLAEKRWKRKGKRRNTKVSVVGREKKGRGGATKEVEQVAKVVEEKEKEKEEWKHVRE